MNIKYISQINSQPDEMIVRWVEKKTTNPVIEAPPILAGCTLCTVRTRDPLVQPGKAF